MYTSAMSDTNPKKDLRDELEDLMRRNRALAESIQARDEFLSIASHELRTPLTALQLQLEITGTQIDPERNVLPTCEQLKRSFETALRQVATLARLLDDLLDLSRLRLGQFELSPAHCDLRQIVSETVEKFLPQLHAAGCPIQCDFRESVLGDWDKNRLEQVIGNLLSNVLKYAAGSPLEISVRQKGGSAEIFVRDQGPGIPKEMQDKVFERFARGPTSERVGGLGIGLFLVKRLVEAHHGTIRLESEPGQGATFLIELPRQWPTCTLAR